MTLSFHLYNLHISKKSDMNVIPIDDTQLTYFLLYYYG
jgi:hypothetical protein